MQIKYGRASKRERRYEEDPTRCARGAGVGCRRRRIRCAAIPDVGADGSQGRAAVRARSFLAAEAAKQLDHRRTHLGRRGQARPCLGASSSANRGTRTASQRGAGRDRVRSQGQVPPGLGRAGAGIRLAGHGARHLRRRQGSGLDYRYQSTSRRRRRNTQRRHVAEVHEGGKVPAADRGARRQRRKQGYEEPAPVG